MRDIFDNRKADSMKIFSYHSNSIMCLRYTGDEKRMEIIILFVHCFSLAFSIYSFVSHLTFIDISYTFVSKFVSFFRSGKFGRDGHRFYTLY